MTGGWGVTHEQAKATKQDLHLVQSVCFSFLSLFALEPGDAFIAFDAADTETAGISGG